METGIIILRERAEARTWAEKNQIKLVGTELIVETGRTWNREKFEAAINDCVQRHKSERIGWVIFPRVDRDARKQIPFWYYIGLLDREGMKVGFAREDTTTKDTPEKLFMLSIHAYKAEADGNTIVTNLWEGKLRRARDEGRFPSWDGGLWPYQYIHSRKRKGGAVRELIPERAVWCRKWYEWLKQGMKGNAIADRMNQSMVPPPRGKRWWRRTIFSILRNPGLRDKASWGGIPLPGASPAIFTEEEGREIDLILRGNLEKAKRNAKEDYELSQHVFCECGARVWGRRNKIGSQVYIRYQCPQCRRYVDKIYLEALTKTKILSAFSDRDKLKTYLNSQERDNTDIIKARLIDMEKQIDRRLTVLHNLRRQHAWGDLTDDEYQSERDKVKSDLAKLHRDKEDLQKSFDAAIDMERDTRILDRIADQISERLALNDIETLKRLYDTLKLKITLTAKAILFSSRIPLEELEVVEATSPRLTPQSP
jgi:DNA invertase Pin-like site-specific DNA recombinase